MLSRRSFLTTTVRSSALVALAPTVPEFLVQTARAAPPARDGRVLVVVQLDGGNDGINTVVPFTDEGYAKHRTALRLPTTRLIKLSNAVGLHPALAPLGKLFEAGGLAVVQGVGYPNPSRSHFKSMAVWHTANADLPRDKGDYEDAQTKAALGWIGRAFDGEKKPPGGGPSAVYVGADSLPVALRGRRSEAATLTRLEDSLLNRRPDVIPDGGAADDGDLAAFVRRRTLEAYATSDRMAEVVKGRDAGGSYPATALSERLRLVARLIKAGTGARVFYVTQRGYDTHTGQSSLHAELLAEFAGAVSAFHDDLAAAHLGERVALMAFSEFGRRVQENGDKGTDHGTAGPVFLAGSAVKGGLIGKTPNLLDLDGGDLKAGVDFRRVYATVLEDWLGLTAKAALGEEFEPLPLFRG
jgi:uncharacterized protein (DUF1501 family)